MNINVSVKRGNICEKDYVWNTAKYNCENQKYLESIMDNSGIIWDEVIDAGAKLSQKEDNDKKKTIPTNFIKKNVTCKTQKFLCFTCIFFNCYSIIDSCQFLLLSDKISSKTKTLPFHYTKLILFENELSS